MPSAPSTNGFADRLHRAIRAVGSPACIGIDPVIEKVPEIERSSDPLDSLMGFSLGVISAAASVVPVVKFQSACYERFGQEGVGILASCIKKAKASGLLVILDAKRGDIGISNEHYAAAIAGMGADAVTVSGYLGLGVVEPFLRAGLGVFVLVRTSNPDGDEIQSQRLADGRTVAEMVADRVAEFGASRRGQSGYSDVGAVVGATKAAEGRELRIRMPSQPFLVPGFGAQGGTLADVQSLSDERGGGVLVTASRSVIYAFTSTNGSWVDEVRHAASAFAQEVRPLAG
jgi:orotidine-5'-phosphate decarboxylase